MLRRVGLALAISLSAQASVATEHLTPPVSGMADYHDILRVVLNEAYAPGVRLRVMMAPSFSPEIAVGLKETNGRYLVFVLSPEQQIWNYSLLKMLKEGRATSLAPDGQVLTDAQIARIEGRLPANPNRLKIDGCLVTIDPAVAAMIVDAWREMLIRTRPQTPSGILLDGETYLFSMEVEGRTLEGSTYSPPAWTAPGELVGLAMAMQGYCRKPDAAQANRVSAAASAVLGHVRKGSGN